MDTTDVQFYLEKNVKVVHIITDLDMGGAEMTLYRLLSRCDRARFSPTVISLMDRGALGDRIAALDIPLYTLNLNPKLPSLKAILYLIKLIRKIKPDIIQGWMYHANLAGFLSSFLVRKPCIWGIRNSFYSLTYEKKQTTAIILISSLLSNLIERIVFVSEISHAQHLKLGYSRRKSLVIPNGIDISIFAPSTQARKSLRYQLGLSDKSILIGKIARFHPQKDHENFLQAAALLRQNRSHLDISFLLCGQGCDRENSTLRQFIERENLTHKVHLLGQREDMPNIAAALDIATSSSFTEAFPNTIAEAMSCGIPCVVTDVGDSAKLVGDFGKVIPSQNPEALARAWQELLDLGDKERHDLGQLARQRIEKNFSLKSSVQCYETLYQEIGKTIT
ncbi:MAG: glycosyltransferase [Cyanobacteria bacterium P01_E01_bin.42]